jgi:hypothetical protein
MAVCILEFWVRHNKLVVCGAITEILGLLHRLYSELDMSLHVPCFLFFSGERDNIYTQI